MSTVDWWWLRIWQQFVYAAYTVFHMGHVTVQELERLFTTKQQHQNTGHTNTQTRIEDVSAVTITCMYNCICWCEGNNSIQTEWAALLSTLHCNNDSSRFHGSAELKDRWGLIPQVMREERRSLEMTGRMINACFTMLMSLIKVRRRQCFPHTAAICWLHSNHRWWSDTTHH